MLTIDQINIRNFKSMQNYIVNNIWKFLVKN